MNRREKSSLAKLFEHNAEHDCCIISAFRPTDNSKISIEINRELSAVLVSTGYAVIKFEGKVLKEAEGNNCRGRSKGNKDNVHKNFFCIVDKKNRGNLKKDLKKIEQGFGQYSFIFSPKGDLENMIFEYNISERSLIFESRELKNPQTGFGSWVYNLYVQKAKKRIKGC